MRSKLAYNSIGIYMYLFTEGITSSRRACEEYY